MTGLFSGLTRRLPKSTWVACLVFGLANVTNAALPVPPRQHAPWKARSVAGIPEYVPGLTAMLFDAGLADPRGGEYREIELRVKWGDSATLTTHGWVFRQGFAVCWDGLAHRVERVGGKADLRADVATAIGDPVYSSHLTIPLMAGSVDIALLLRLGEPELARQIFLKRRSFPVDFRSPDPPERPGYYKLGWFEMAATSWLIEAWNQAVIAHADCDDRSTIDLSEFLLATRPAMESARRSMGPIYSYGVWDTHFLDAVPALLADSERRLRETPRPPLDPGALHLMVQSKRNGELIDRLEDFNEQQTGQPGGFYFQRFPVFKMLEEEGADAVGPLVDAMDNDHRIARTYGIGPGYVSPFHLFPVSDVAEVLLQDYFQIRPFRWEDPAKRKAWLLANKNRSLAERGFDLLADDSNEELQWLDAAELLLRPSGSGVVGDALRRRRDPSVSELLAKRAAQTKASLGDRIGDLLRCWEALAARQ